MDEQRAWIKMRRKKRFRMLAVAVCVFVLVTTAFAGEGVTGGSDAVQYALGTLMDDSSMPISDLADDDIAIDENNFPDENFREYIEEKIDSDRNGSLSSYERKAAGTLSVSYQGISNLKGIEYFTELIWLFCSGNELTELDVSNNTKLEELYCSENNLTKLDVSQNKALKVLDCTDNELTELDVSNNIALEELHCYYNEITKLDVSSNTALKILDCQCIELTELNVNNNTALKKLYCQGNNLTKLDVSHNTELILLACSRNKLTKLDVSSNTVLQTLNCDENNLTGLDMSSNIVLTTLDCDGNNLTALDVSSNTVLTALYCYNNNLTTLDVSNNTKLTNLSCYGNELTELDVSNNTALASLKCSNNNLTALDVSNNTKLTTFSCSDNEYTVSTCLLDPSALSEGFELSNASGWTNSKFTDDNKIFYLGEEKDNVKYTYDCGNNKTATFTLKFQPHNCTKVDARGACTEDGNIEYYECTVCGYKFQNSTPTAESDILTDNDIMVPAVGEHDYGDWKIASAPSLTEMGTRERVCSRDSTHIDTEDIPALTDASVWTKDETQHVEPTEEETGRDVYKSEQYGEVEVILPKKEHTHIYGTEFKYDETSHWKECVCKEKQEFAAHEFGEWITDKEATESDEGLKHRSCQICNYEESETIPVKGNILTDGNIDKEVQTDGRAPDTYISTSTKEMADMLLTDGEKQQVEVGTDIMIVLDVKDASGSVSSEDKTKVEAALNNDTTVKGNHVGQYLDISLYKLVGETRTDITETPRKITIRIVIPDSLKNSDSKKIRNFAVIRVHDGQIKLLTDLDDNADTITIETDRFSTYVIVYKDTEAGGSNNSDNNNTGNGNNGDNNNTGSGNNSDNNNAGNGNNGDNNNAGSGNNSSNNSAKPDLSKDNEPMTGENMYFEKYAALAMIVGFIWILLYLAARRRA